MYVFLSHFNPDIILTSFFSKISFNIIFPFTPVSHTLFHLQVIQPQYFLRVSNSQSTVCAAYPAVHQFSDDHHQQHCFCSSSSWNYLHSLPRISTFPTVRCTLALSHSVTDFADFRPVQNGW